MSRRRSLVTNAVYGLLIAGAAFNVIWALVGPGGKAVRYRSVQVSGNVTRPGMYRVPEGTTRWEILKVAGVNPTSDLMSVDLSQQVGQGDALAIGTLADSAAVRKDTALVALEFYFGEITVLDREGRSRPFHEGMSMQAGDRVLTEARSQAEFSVNAFSRIDVDDFSELTFDKIGAGEDGRRATETFQRAGVSWYKIVYADRNESFKALTPLASAAAGGTGADYMVDAKPEQTMVHCLEGLVLVERPGTEESVNLIAGQTAAVFNDGRPLQVQSLAPDVNPRGRFAQLAKEKSDQTLRQMPLNLLLYGIPNSFYFISIRYDQGVAHIVSLPENTSVAQFAQGASTLSAALLQMGPVLTNTLVEKIMDTRVAKYYMFGRDDVIRIFGALGSITVTVDARAASAMKIRSGRQKLTSDELQKFLLPTISGWGDARRRQVEVLKAFFEGMQSRGIVMTAILASQLVAGLETNLTAADLMSEYDKFGERRAWTFKYQALPGQETTQGGSSTFEPMLDMCKTMLHAR